MKKLFIIAVLAFAALPAFSQEDEYARFQGSWIGMIGDDELTMFIFEDDSFFAGIDGVHFGKYVIKDNNMILKYAWEFLGYPDGWSRKKGESEIQYVFSGDKLILVFDGSPITYSKGIKDLPLF